MTEQGEANKYIKCSKCRCKYINNDEHVKNDFGYSRLNERFKTCVKCREKRKLNYNPEYDKAHREANKEALAERMSEYIKQRFQDNKVYFQEKQKEYRERQLNKEVCSNEQCCVRCYKIKPNTDYGEYKTMVEIDGTRKLQEAMVPYRSCKACRDRDNRLRVGWECVG